MYRYIRNGIFVGKDGKLDIDFYNDSTDSLHTQFGKSKVAFGKDRFSAKPYVAEDKLLNGHVVYSVSTYSSPKQVDILKAVKHGDLDPELYHLWLTDVARYIQSAIIAYNRPDVIVTPQSSSTLIDDLAKILSRICRISYLPVAFIKNPPSEITLEIPEGVNVSPNTLKKLEKQLERVRHGEKFEAKGIFKQYGKFFRNMYTCEDNYAKELYNKKVLVLDDAMSSRATMSNIFDVCDYLYETAESYGVTIFKRSGTRA